MMAGNDPEDLEHRPGENNDWIPDPTATVPGIALKDILGDDLDVRHKALSKREGDNWQSLPPQDTSSTDDKRREWDSESGKWKATGKVIEHVPDPAAFTSPIDAVQRPPVVVEEPAAFGFEGVDEDHLLNSDPAPHMSDEKTYKKGIFSRFLAILGL